MSVADSGNIVDAMSAWYSSLSSTGKFIDPIVGLAGLAFVLIILRIFYSGFILFRRFVRRKLIPGKVDLRLDRDIAPEHRRDPSVDSDQNDSASDSGSTLKERIEQMRKSAPVRKGSDE